MLTVGQLGLALGLLGTIGAIIALFIGHVSGKTGRPITRLGHYLTLVGATGFTLASVVLTAAFFAGDYSIYYVASNHANDTSSLSWLYTLSGLWAGREGSLLFWAWLMTFFTSYLVVKAAPTEDKLTNIALIVMNFIIAIFGLAMVLTEANNPFIALPPGLMSANGELIGQAASWGMNPLLQHWAMILHPPTLFVGYAGLAVPFAYAIAALVLRDGTDAWVAKSDRITVFSWLFLGAGIGLGSVWAYLILDWGGFWGWDPVENASALPWFVGLAMIHSFTMYRRRDAFKVWALMLAAITFSMVILGTFITRSGIVQSLHAFSPDNTSFWLFLLLIVGAPALVAGLWATRRNVFKGNDEFENLNGREAAYYFNNVLMTIASLLIAYMTVSPALPAWMPFGGQSLGAVAYEMIARPVGILYMAILAFCPLLSWGKTEGSTFWSKFKWPLVASLLLFSLLAADWWFTFRPVWDDMVAFGGEPAREFSAFGPKIIYDIIAVLALFIGSVTVMTNGALFVRGTAARMKAMGESAGLAFWRVLTKARKQSGGYMSHIAMGILVIGLVGSSMYVRDETVKLEGTPGSIVAVGEYTLEFTGSETVTSEAGDREDFYYFDVSKNGVKMGSASPSIEKKVSATNPTGHAWIVPNFLADVFVSFQQYEQETNTISINVKINPLIWFVWVGFGLLLVGTALAAWPSRRRAA